MSKISYIILLFLLFQVEVNAQVITGKVYDRANLTPIADAHIYLNGSSYFTITSDSGTFHMEVREKLNTQMIVSHLLYETLVIDQPFDKESRAIYLTEKQYKLDEVVIKPDFRFTRREMMNAFEIQFLGDNKAGKSCKILNKDDIQLYYDETSKTLRVKSDRPIVVENDYLGYQVQILLNDFQVSYKHHTLKERDIETYLLRGKSFFKDMAPHNSVIQKRRNEAYQISANYFFKNLALGTIKKSKYIIYNCNVNNTNNNYRHFTPKIDIFCFIDPKDFFDIIDKGEEKTIRIKQNTNINKNTSVVYSSPYPIFGVITVSDPKGGYSEIIFHTREFTVDKFGIITDKKDYIYLTGQMYNLRVGNMVPMDYE